MNWRLELQRMLRTCLKAADTALVKAKFSNAVHMQAVSQGARVHSMLEAQHLTRSVLA